METKNDGFNLSVDFYPGLFSGQYDNLSQTSYGLFTPIGLDFSWCKQHYGFFLSVFDFGSNVAWRFPGGHFLLSDGTFGQIFSPGIFIKCSLCEHSPVTILLGVEDNISAESNETYSRWGISFAYDIPFFFFSIDQ